PTGRRGTARPRHPGRAASPASARDRGVLPRAGRRAEGHLGRPARDRGGDRARRRHLRGRPTRRRQPSGGRGRASPRGARQSSDRADLAAGKAPRGRGAARRRPVRRDGRTAPGDLRRVATVFVPKSAFAVVLIISIGLTNIEYPLLPRHLSLAALVTIGIPSFFLALAPSTGPFSTKGFLREVSRFAVPAGTAAGLAVIACYLFSFEVANMPL